MNWAIVSGFTLRKQDGESWRITFQRQFNRRKWFCTHWYWHICRSHWSLFFKNQTRLSQECCFSRKIDTVLWFWRHFVSWAKPMGRDLFAIPWMMPLAPSICKSCFMLKSSKHSENLVISVNNMCVSLLLENKLTCLKFPNELSISYQKKKKNISETRANSRNRHFQTQQRS